MYRCFALIFAFFLTSPFLAQQVFHQQIILMGSDFEITVVTDDSISGKRNMKIAIDEIIRIEKIISSWDSLSETSSINRNAGIRPVKVCDELFDLITRSIVISKLTDGAFDITYASMDRLWKFDGSMKEFPSDKELLQSISKVGYENIVLDEKEKTVFLPLKGMKIGFGGIGKGYAADKAKKLLIEKGVTAGIINASGDMNTWGKNTNGEFWNVAITNPLDKNKAFALVPLESGAVVTSGNYEKFVVFEGVRYSHIIDPRTGIPASGIISVSVFAESAEAADAIATSVFVMGVSVGIDRVNQFPNIECIIVNNRGEVYTSDGISINNLKTN